MCSYGRLNVETVPCKTSEKFIRNSLALAACRDNTERRGRRGGRKKRPQEVKALQSHCLDQHSHYKQFMALLYSETPPAK